MIAWWLVGCAPDPCEAMCEAAVGPRWDCLARSGLDWEAAGYADAEDFEAACRTWAWEMRLLEEDAGLEGEVDAACALRAEALAAPGADCDTWSRWDWNALPWEGR